MRRFLLFGIILLMAGSCWAGAPTRTYTYTTGQTIAADEVGANEDSIFTYLQAGVDTIADGSVATGDIAGSAVTSAKILDGTVTGSDLSSSVAITTSGAYTSTSTIATSSTITTTSTDDAAVGVTGGVTTSGLNVTGTFTDKDGDVGTRGQVLTNYAGLTNWADSADTDTFADGVTSFAWVRFNGDSSDPITPDDSYNVTNVTDSGTGKYTINWSITFGNTNYVVVGSGSDNGHVFRTGDIATTTAKVETYGSGGSLIDDDQICAIAMGD